MGTAQAFVLIGDSSDRPARNDHATGRGSGGSAIERISAALDELRRVRIRPMSRDEANRVTGMLGEMQSMATSLMCDVAARSPKPSRTPIPARY